MQKVQIKGLLGKTFLLLWAIMWIVIFVYLPGSVSILYGSTIEAWPLLSIKLARIDLPIYALDLLSAIGGIAIFSLAGISVGSVCLTYILKEQKSTGIIDWLAKISTAFLVGQGLLSIIFLVLGINAQLTPEKVLFTLAGSLLIGIPLLIKFVSEQVRTKRSIKTGEQSDRFNQMLIWLISSVLLFSLLYSTARLSYDSVGMYFSDAKITALSHQIRFFVSDSFLASSFHTGIQYAAIIQVFGDQASRLYSWVNGAAILIFMLALGDKLGFSRRAKLIALTLMVTSTAFLDLLGDGKIDLACTAPALAAIYWMEKNKENWSKKIFILIGFLVGFAMAARPNNIFLLSIFIGLFYLQHAYHNKKDKKQWFYNLLLIPLFFGGTGVVAWMLFHVAINYYMLGDALAFVHNYQGLDPAAWQWSFDRNQIWILRLLYPLTVTVFNTPQSLGTISPLFVALLPGLFIPDLRKKLQLSQEVIGLLVAAVISLFLWVMLFWTVFEIRYVLFLWVLLFLPAALIIEKLMEAYDSGFRNIIKSLVVVTLAFIALRAVYISVDTYSPTDKNGNPHCFDSVFCKYLVSINEAAAPGERILTLNAFRFYLRTDLFACSTTAEEYSQIRELSHGDSETFWREIYQQGYQYIAYEANYSKRHLFMKMLPGSANTPAWLTLKPISGKLGDPVVAYQIIAHNPPDLAQKRCEKNGAGVWEIKAAEYSK